MQPTAAPQRGAFDALEHDRITRFSQVLRRYRIDELPQIVNVLRGQMSLIGPRPDCYEHALEYLQQVPNYALRHQVLPGISGLAQTEVGYADEVESINDKVAADLLYVANASLRLDMWITWRTITVILGRKGA